MFAVSFDDLKRKMIPKGIYLKKLCTAFPGTPDYEAYMALHNAPENDTVFVQLEDDLKTATFFTIHHDPKMIEKERQQKWKEYDEQRKREAGEASFV